ncbi:S23 ribosomal protein [Isosphaera pallida ATCC 43644]|jgi:four helix bundle protein|uniref:S23 ribosomal protein n=1 Tax=Isosphaera pallida (strain ATCC 43644 / DSM 9630 / IS1B) TaxID=575540 RepID=E8R2K1_ISOPI|nr:four helix bundle protein [Isosphaera pallida]ADV62501.1 S23 ribosomal protein [Isosphaera pallida ATCC 43644]
MTVTLQSYRDLEVWRKAMDLAVICYRVTRSYPKQELFGLTTQIRRASSSIPANIAEGQGRQSTKEFLNFLSIARGSLKELETHLILSWRLHFLPKPILDDLLNQTETISRMIAGLRKSLENRL